ncbi:MAG: anti-sigma factor antagonist [Chloroflexi bacterium]|nr:MAG: anti-sigma factor antagonist [Chloroflexota bacterium]
MEIQVERNGTVAVVAVAGQVEAATAPQLREQFDGLLGDGEQNFVIDLSGVTFMDSSGLATLVQLFKRVRIGHGDVRLCGLQPEVQRIFELTRLDRVFDLFPDRVEAVASFH